jgi:hypothetical protein
MSNSIWAKNSLLSPKLLDQIWVSHSLPNNRYGINRLEREGTHSFLSSVKVKYELIYTSSSKPLRGVQKLYRVIHKFLRDFRPLRYSSRDGQAEGEHVNRGRDNPSFCPTLQVLDMSTPGDAADVDLVITFLPHTCIARVWQELDYRIDICRVTRGGHIEHL